MMDHGAFMNWRTSLTDCWELFATAGVGSDEITSQLDALVWKWPEARDFVDRWGAMEPEPLSVQILKELQRTIRRAVDIGRISNDLASEFLRALDVFPPSPGQRLGPPRQSRPGSDEELFYP